MSYWSLVKKLENLDCALSKLGTFSFLNFTTQMGNAEAGALDQRIHELYSKCGTETVFFELEWNQVDEKQALALLDSPATRSIPSLPQGTQTISSTSTHGTRGKIAS